MKLAIVLALSCMVFSGFSSLLDQGVHGVGLERRILARVILTAHVDGADQLDQLFAWQAHFGCVVRARSRQALMAEGLAQGPGMHLRILRRGDVELLDEGAAASVTGNAPLRRNL